MFVCTFYYNIDNRLLTNVMHDGEIVSYKLTKFARETRQTRKISTFINYGIILLSVENCEVV